MKLVVLTTLDKWSNILYIFKYLQSKLHNAFIFGSISRALYLAVFAIFPYMFSSKCYVFETSLLGANS